MFFSIIIPVHNGEKYIARCVDSVLAQSFADFELILIENNSEDNSASLLLGYAERDKRVKVVVSKEVGVSNARNVGLNIASGEIICFVDIDDEVKINYLIESNQLNLEKSFQQLIIGLFQEIHLLSFQRTQSSS